MKTKNIPTRRCAVCMEIKEKKDLQRIAYYEGELSVDLTGKAKGRVTYICKNDECVNLAKKKKALQRAFKTNFNDEKIDEILELIKGEKK